MRGPSRAAPEAARKPGDGEEGEPHGSAKAEGGAVGWQLARGDLVPLELLSALEAEARLRVDERGAIRTDVSQRSQLPEAPRWPKVFV